jgi:hypothetical protein
MSNFNTVRDRFIAAAEDEWRLLSPSVTLTEIVWDSGVGSQAVIVAHLPDGRTVAVGELPPVDLAPDTRTPAG